MTRFSWANLAGVVLVSAVIWATLAAACLLVGTTELGVPSGRQLEYRLWAVAAASVVGAALSASGVTYQSVLRNPLADPYLLGVSAGATLGVVLWRLPAMDLVPVLSAVGMQTAALAGALGAAGVVFLVASGGGAGRRLEPTALLLTGVVVSTVCGAALVLIVSLRPELLAAQGGGAAGVLVGGLQTSLTRTQIYTAGAVVAAGVAALYAMAGAMSVAGLSDTEATALGVNVARLRWAALVLASVVVSAAIAISGPIGFVGLICPHLGRLLVGPDPRKLLPVATALGAGLLCVADAGGRLLAQQQVVQSVLPVGVFTAMLGGPFFLLLLARRRQEASR